MRVQFVLREGRAGDPQLAALRSRGIIPAGSGNALKATAAAPWSFAAHRSFFTGAGGLGGPQPSPASLAAGAAENGRLVGTDPIFHLDNEIDAITLPLR